MAFVVATCPAKQSCNGLADVARLLLRKLREGLGPTSVIAKHSHPLPRRDRVEKRLGGFDPLDSQDRLSASTSRVQVRREGYIAGACKAVGHVLLGLTVATIVGVPLTNWLGQVASWRWCFGIVAALALATAILVAIYVPNERQDKGASVLRELGALRRSQVWLTLAMGAIGFGGLFSVYTYRASTLMAVTAVPARIVPIVLAAQRPVGLGQAGPQRVVAVHVGRLRAS